MRFVGILTVSVPLEDRGERTLVKPLSYITASGETITIPEGTRTDYASVPKALHAVLPPTGRYTYPAVLHDYLYRTGRVTRAEADKLFLESMGVSRVSPQRRWIMWAGVRLGGWAPWRRYRRGSAPHA